jgi:molecular chaperone IbpA
MTAYSIPRSWTVGFDQFFDRIESSQNNQTYPPHNVIKHSDNSFEIAIAVAGFKEEDLKVTLDKSQLKIEGNDSASSDVEYLHKGIGTRKFEKSFDLAEHVQVKGVTLANGVLSITLEKEIPEELQPKVFDINGKSSEKEFLSE